MNAKTWVLALMVAAGACADENDSTRVLGGNDELAIAEFRLTETPTMTTLVGVDVNEVEVAHLDLLHGRFALTGVFREDYATPEVDGRQLNITVHGEKLHWETAGYEPVRELPAPPWNQRALSKFVADPVVARTLGRWEIGFEPGLADALNGENAYVGQSGSFRGSSPQTCNNATSCGSTLNGTINTCGSMAAAFAAASVTQAPGTNCGLYTASYNQVLVAQCCPAGSGGQNVTWYAQKACPTTTDNSTSCGTRTAGSCKSCPEYPVDASTLCTVSVGATVGTCGSAVYPVNWQYKFPICHPGCMYESQCWQDDGCGGQCSSWGGYCLPDGCVQLQPCI